MLPSRNGSGNARLLLPHHRRDAENSGLNDQTIQAAELHSLTSPEEIAQKLGWRRPARQLGACLEFPFFDVNGNLVPDFSRLKPDHPVRHKGSKKPAKYESPVGRGNHAYFVPGTFEILEDSRKALLLGEGEKKLLAAKQAGFDGIGLTGVWNFVEKRERGPDGKPIGPPRLIADLKAVAWTGRTVTICHDADVPENPKVDCAARYAARLLLGEGAIVKIAKLPHILGPDGQPLKTGIDDFLLQHSPTELRKVLDEAAYCEPAVGPDGLRYFCRDFDIGIRPKKDRWQVAIYRNGETLTANVLDIASVRARQDLLRSIRGLSDEEVQALDRKLISLTDRVEKDWMAHQNALLEESQRSLAAFLEKAEAVQAAQNEEHCRQIGPVAIQVLEDPRLLWRVAKAITGRGVIGERPNAILVWLALLSQITDKPISIIVKGDSAGGKSFLVLQVLALFDSSDYIDLTSMSERALIYSERDFRHKTCVIFEAKGQENELLSYVIRTLISEGCIKYHTVESTPNGLRSREITKDGPINFVTTTTAPEIHAENETRIWSLLVDDSPKATRLVLKIQSLIAEGRFVQKDDPDLRTAITWLRSKGATKYVIPFAERLSRTMPDRPLRLRRDFPRLLQLIGLSAILHQRQRQIDGQGRVVATLADYGMCREIVGAVFTRGVLGLSENTIELVRHLEEILRGKDDMMATASYADVVGKTGKNKMYVSRWLRPALDLGVVENTSAGQKGKAAALKLGNYRLENYGGLPTVEALLPGDRSPWINPLNGKPYQYRNDPTVTVFSAPAENQRPQPNDPSRDTAGALGEPKTVTPYQSIDPPSYDHHGPEDGGPRADTLLRFPDGEKTSPQPVDGKRVAEPADPAKTVTPPIVTVDAVPVITDEDEFEEGSL
jgi:hypothetical protein